MLRASMGFVVLAISSLLFGLQGLAGLSYPAGENLLLFFLALASVSAMIHFFEHNRSKVTAWFLSLLHGPYQFKH